VNSGIMGVGFGPNPPFAVKFSGAGTFPYICILHVDQGMGGTITVSQSAAPAPPKTGGTTGLASSVTPAAVVGMLAALTLLLLGGSRMAVRRPR
jgi:hypothetical protein